MARIRKSPVIQARDGSFCGTAEYGGTGYNGAAATGDGLVFRLVLPMFLSNPFTQAVATVGVPYAASLTANSIRPPGDTVLFAKLSGPAWLNVGSDGTLSGTPAVSDIGTNTFTVSLFDTNGWSCAATMSVTVVPSPWIKAAMVRQGANLWLTWSGRTAPYQVQMATDLQNPVWVNITGPLTTNSLLLPPTAAAACTASRASNLSPTPPSCGACTEVAAESPEFQRTEDGERLAFHRDQLLLPELGQGARKGFTDRPQLGRQHPLGGLEFDDDRLGRFRVGATLDQPVRQPRLHVL